LVQAVIDMPMTVYGQGGQTRGFLDIRDTLACVELALNFPAARGEFRVFNQFTEQFNVLQLAHMVHDAAKTLGINATIQHLENPRVEKEAHYYNAANSKLIDLGLQPHLLNDTLLNSVMHMVYAQRQHVRSALVMPSVSWRSTNSPVMATPAATSNGNHA